MAPGLNKTEDDMDWQKTAENMKKRGFTVRRYATGAEAAEALCEELKGQEIGMGGSMTAAQMGLPEKLEAAGCTVYARGKSWAKADTDHGVTAPVYISSANGVAETGELVNIDGTGNRVAALCFGPTQVVVVAGMNKVAGDLDGAMRRAREVAAPMNAQRFPLKTPCVANGLCGDCKGPDSICAQIVITRMCKPAGRIKVVLVGEDLGF